MYEVFILLAWFMFSTIVTFLGLLVREMIFGWEHEVRLNLLLSVITGILVICICIWR